MKNIGPLTSTEWLCELIAIQMNMAFDQVHARMHLIADLGVDSLELQSLLIAIEDLVGVMPEGAQMQRIITVGDLHALVLRLLEAKKNPGSSGVR